MFVSDNSVKSLKVYFQERLVDVFSDREIRFILNHCLQQRLNLSRAELILADNLRLSESDLLYFRSIVKRLQNGEPFQYVIGDTEFYGLTIKVDPRVLIPRPETEELVDWIVKEHPQSREIIDVCTGSGCIALAIKSVLPDANVMGLDISEGALTVAKENAVLTQLNVSFSSFDALADEINVADETLDIIVSNPPYITSDEKKLMKDHVLDHEPHLALFVENDKALIFYEKIALQAMKKLKKGAWIYYELNEHFGEEMIMLMNEIGFQEVELREDLQGRNRMLRAKR